MEFLKRNYQKIIAVVVGVALVTASIFLIIALNKNIPISESEVTYKHQSEVLDFDVPTTGATAIGTLKYGTKVVYGGDDPRPTASMAKVITALVALDKNPNLTEQVFTISARDVERYLREVVRNGSRLNVVEGEELTGYQAIEALMVVSANNIAESLVRWVFDDFDSYKIAAEEWLAKNGLENTAIGADASGFDPGTTSTPSDMIKIGQLALQNEIMREIMAKESTTFSTYVVEKNTNQLLAEDYIGIKTGNSDQALSCLLFAGEYYDDIIIGVMMGQPFNSTFDSARKIWASLDQNFTNLDIPANTVVGKYILPWGGEVEVATTEKLEALTWRDAQPEISFDSIDLDTNYKSEVGTITLGNQTASLRINTVIEKPSIWWRLQNLF